MPTATRALIVACSRIAHRDMATASCLDGIAERRWSSAMGFVPYIVRGGEYLLQIAHRMGFDPDAVWNADENREVRKERCDSNILAPGDILCVPEATKKKWLSVDVGCVQSALVSAHGS